MMVLRSRPINTQKTLATRAKDPKVFARSEASSGESSFSTWPHRITFNIVLMRFRKKRLGEISLEDTFDIDDEFGTPRKQIGQVDLNTTGLLDRLA